MWRKIKCLVEVIWIIRFEWTISAGRRDNKWISSPGCLQFSQVIKKVNPSNAVFIQYLMAIAIVESVIDSTCPNVCLFILYWHKFPIGIKWPNDIYISPDAPTTISTNNSPIILANNLPSTIPSCNPNHESSNISTNDTLHNVHKTPTSNHHTGTINNLPQSYSDSNKIPLIKIGGIIVQCSFKDGMDIVIGTIILVCDW